MNQRNLDADDAEKHLIDTETAVNRKSMSSIDYQAVDVVPMCQCSVSSTGACTLAPWRFSVLMTISVIKLYLRHSLANIEKFEFFQFSLNN